MFAQSDVDALFADTARSLRRSQFLLDERSRGPAPDAPAVMPRTPSFAAALADLRALTDLSAYLDASEDVARRLKAEASAPSAAVARRRAQYGAKCPLLRRVADGIASAAAGPCPLGGRGNDNNNNNNNNSYSNDNSNGMRRGQGLWDGAAAVAAALLLAGVCADWRHDPSLRNAPNTEQINSEQINSEQPNTEWPNSKSERSCDDVAEGLARARPALPDDVADELDASVVRVAAGLSTSPNSSTSPSISVSPSALLAVPALLAHVVRRAAPGLSKEYVVSPLRAAAAALPAAHSADAASFRLSARRLTHTAALLVAHSASGIFSKAPSEERRVALFAKEVIDALLDPLERFFAAAPASAAAALDVHSAVAVPLRALLPHVAQCVPSLKAVWCTACYRALLIVETLANMEIGVLSGKGSAAAQQKRYESMLRQSNGRVTTALLATVTEDRQLLFEETTARSAQGHRVFRIHAGDTDGRGAAVFVYVEDGTVFLKIGRERAFRRAKSVEEVFAIFNSPSTP